jgi:putative transposase
VKRPRVRSADGESEVELSTYRHFADRDPLSRLVLEQMLAGVSVRRFSRTREPVGEEIEATARATSKSAVSRDFVARTKEKLIGLMSRPLADIRLTALMLDGIELKGRCCVVALGIDTDGVKHPLGLWDGSTENATVARELLTNLVARPRSRVGRAVCDRWRQGAAQGDRAGARARARAEIYSSQGMSWRRASRRRRLPRW